MEPTLKIGDRVIADPFSYRLPGRKIMRGDLAVHRTPGRGKTLFIQRVLGVPGDEAKIIKGYLFLNGVPDVKSRLLVNDMRIYSRSMDLQQFLMPCKEGRLAEDYCSVLETEYNWLIDSASWKVADGQYFLLGDNAYNSFDSKNFGPLDRKDIEARIACFGFGPDLGADSFEKMGGKIR